jgi:hypothetical protein
MYSIPDVAALLSGSRPESRALVSPFATAGVSQVQVSKGSVRRIMGTEATGESLRPGVSLGFADEKFAFLSIASLSARTLSSALLQSKKLRSVM